MKVYITCCLTLLSILTFSALHEAQADTANFDYYEDDLELASLIPLKFVCECECFGHESRQDKIVTVVYWTDREEIKNTEEARNACEALSGQTCLPNPGHKPVPPHGTRPTLHCATGYVPG